MPVRRLVPVRLAGLRTAAKTTSYSYDNRGLRTTETKGNKNKSTFSWFDNGLMASSREVKPDGTSLVAEHILGYDLDGNRTTDAAKVLNSDTKAVDSSSATYAYEPRGRVTSVTRTGAGATNEAYTYTATSDISTQTVGGVSTSFVYDRNRLLKATTGGVASYYSHDPFGRLDTITSGGAVVGRYVYDGFDRVVEQRSVAGGVTKTTKSTYDAWDRVAAKTDAAGKTAAMSYLGLTSQVLAELDKATNKPTDEYTFDAYGQRLTQSTTKTDGSTEDAWYGYNPHSDVETLTTSTGDTKATYGYTAYGKDRTGAMTGADKPGASSEPYNLYRFNAKRWDATTGDYDMGFRTFNPGLNRFVSRDSYNGALADLNLGVDPWNTNRYAFAGGNPITGIEFDGHCAFNPETGDGCGLQVKRTLNSGSNPPPEPETQPTETSTGGKIARWFGEKPLGERATEELVVKPAVETYEACKAAIQMDSYWTNWQQCKSGTALMGLSFTGGGKVVGVGVRTAEGLAAARAEAATAGALLGRTSGSAANAAADLVAGARTAGGIGASRNVAGMTLEAGNTRISGVAVSGAASRAGMVPNVGSAGNLQRFVPTATGNNARYFDSEFKLLNYAANQLGPSSNVGGVLRLHSELPVCSSCSSVINQFTSAYPNIRIFITTG
jgi:RHS repeat-associated protein